MWTAYVLYYMICMNESRKTHTRKCNVCYALVQIPQIDLCVFQILHHVVVPRNARSIHPIEIIIKKVIAITHKICIPNTFFHGTNKFLPNHFYIPCQIRTIIEQRENIQRTTISFNVHESIWFITCLNHIGDVWLSVHGII